MKVAILAGGVGSRLSEETELRPKPMVEIGGRPILWHIMKHYAAFGLKDFVIALGYKGDYIKKYMLNYASLSGNICIDPSRGEVHRDTSQSEDWKISLVETGTKNANGRTHQATGAMDRRLDVHADMG